MLGRLLDALMGAGERGLPEPDARLALATLLVRVARVDSAYDAREIAVIDAVLARRYSLTTAEAAAMRAEAELEEARAPDTVRFTRLVKDAVAYEDRLAVVEALWRVALADTSRSEDENGFLRLTVNLLGVSDRDSGIVRQGVERGRDEA